MKIKRGRLAAAMDIMSFAIAALGTALLIVFWDKIPREIPMHYDISGNVDRFGPKSGAIVLVCFAWAIYILLTVVEMFPKIWNTGVKVTEENRELVYRTIYRAVSSMKLILTATFAYITFGDVLGNVFSPWAVLILLLTAAANMIFWLRKLAKAGKM